MNINDIPFFRNKQIVIHKNIYSNDPYPMCFLVSDRLKTYKIRLASEFNPHAIVRECNALEYLKKQDHKLCADIIEADIDGDPKSHYLIETFLDGKSLEKYETSELKAYVHLLVEKLSAYLYEVHNLHSHEFHSFIGDGYETYLDMLIAHLYNHINSINAYDSNIAVYLSNVIKLLHKHNISMINIVPSFLHFDFKPQNIIFDIKTLNIAVVDFEHSRFGDPLHELIRSRFKFSKNELFIKKLWDEIERKYIQKNNYIIHPIKSLLYHFYYYVTELTYLFKINDIKNIAKYKHLIEKAVSDIKSI